MNKDKLLMHMYAQYKLLNSTGHYDGASALSELADQIDSGDFD